MRIQWSDTAYPFPCRFAQDAKHVKSVQCPASGDSAQNSPSDGISIITSQMLHGYRILVELTKPCKVFGHWSGPIPYDRTDVRLRAFPPNHSSKKDYNCLPWTPKQVVTQPIVPNKKQPCTTLKTESTKSLPKRLPAVSESD